MTRIVGCDPGVNGALAFWDTNIGELWAVPLKSSKNEHGNSELDLAHLDDALNGGDPHIMVLESVWGIRGARSAFTFGTAYGAILCAAASRHVRVERVLPKVWQSVVLPGVHERKNLKKASKAFALSEYGLETKSHDVSDAVCLLHYGRQVFIK